MMSALLDSGRFPGFPMRRFCSTGLGRRPDPLPPTAAPPTKQDYLRRRESDSADVGALSPLWKMAQLCGWSGSMMIADGHSSIIPVAAARWVPFDAMQHHLGRMMVARVQRQPLGIIRHHLACMTVAVAGWQSLRLNDAYTHRMTDVGDRWVPSVVVVRLAMPSRPYDAHLGAVIIAGAWCSRRRS